MNDVNLHHLRYFWLVAREGSVVAACRRAGVAQPTVSAQLRRLEADLGHRLFEKRGRGLVLTEAGRAALRVCDEIFALSSQLADTLAGRGSGVPLRLSVGVADVVPKLIAHHLVAPAFTLDQPVRLLCTEGKPGDLIARLAAHELDIVLSDAPLSPLLNIRAFTHELGHSGVTLFAVPALARRLRRAFPGSLDGAPVLLPTATSAMRHGLEAWFEAQSVRPRVVAEIEDGALIKVFGQSGLGVFPGSTVIEREIVAQYGVQVVGQVAAVRQTFYALSCERRFKHPAVTAIVEKARRELFSSKG